MRSVKLLPPSMAENRPWAIKSRKQQTWRAFGWRRQSKPSLPSVLCALLQWARPKGLEGCTPIQMGSLAQWPNLGLFMVSVVASTDVCDGWGCQTFLLSAASAVRHSRCCNWVLGLWGPWSSLRSGGTRTHGGESQC